ncbi:MAG: hypothetical protein ACLQJ0_27150 [Steroidobacteraceae bacterium]
MTRSEARAALQRALELSRELATIADSGEIEVTIRLDADRLQLLKAACGMLRPADDHERGLLREIIALNAVAIGTLQHRQRAMARDLDMMSVGRRAMRAYSATGLRR